MALMQYPMFYRLYGIRRTDQMIKPPMPTLSQLSLPRNAVYHYLGVGPLDDGPTEKENALKDVKKTMFIATVGELTRTLGNPRHLPIQVDRLARNHRVKHPKFLLMKELALSQRDPNVPVVYNYAFLHRLYKYQRNYYANYNRWENFYATLWNTVAQIAIQSEREQFVEFDLPRILPSISALRSAESEITQKTASIFSNGESVAMLELWKWLGENRKLSSMNAIRSEDFNKINIIFRETDRWFVINIGKLNEWRGPSKEELKEVENDPKALADLTHTKGFPPSQLQKRFLRLGMALFEARTGSPDQNLGTEDDAVKPAEAIVAPESSPNIKISEAEKAPKPSGTPILGPVSPPMEGKNPGRKGPTIDASPSVLAEKNRLEDELPDLDEVERDELAERQAEQNEFNIDENVQPTALAPDPNYLHDLDGDDIDKDLEQLERIVDNAHPDPEDEQSNNFEVIIPEAKDLVGSIIEHANALADAGGLSAAEYRRYVEAAGNYKKIVAPNGKPMGEFAHVKPHEVVLKESTKIPDKQTITDKTMRSSSLFDFDKKYVNEVMQRDVAGMVMSLQKAGVLVLDYVAHESEDITGAYIEYAVKIKPLQGTPSTLRFKMPKVSPDGSFTINSVNYRTRKQRGDLPIRKLTPTRVALTSYYGKLFAERSPKKVNDYARWLRDKIMAMGLDQHNTLVTNLVPGNSFDPRWKAPRLYTMLSMGFRGFTVHYNQYELNFNFDTRGEIPNYEAGDNVRCGQTQIGQLITMAPDGSLYVVKQGSALEPLPTLENMLTIESAKAPVEYVELRVFGKMIPIGVILGYLMGLENLIKQLGIRPRIVQGTQRVEITVDEWTIPFEDETWVFNRDDVVASLVLAGWRDFDKTTKSYSFDEFNRKDVYFNLLEDHGLSVRYLREMDLMNQMFIDPICLELLTDMGEPTVFTQLLIRACALLATDDHPHELDSKFMRIKGYERFSGLLYNELVKSIRVHNAKVSKSTQPLEMNPYAVWIAISEDPAKDQALEINPIKELKEIEAVTYSGTGGRSGRSMVKRTRAFHPSDMGVISEATSDSSDVGINTFLTADPQFKSLRGVAKPYEYGKTGQTAALSTSALVSVSSDRDDVKRANFISIQHAHGVAVKGNHQTQVRTGYEQVIPHRVSDLYAVMAKGPGKIVAIDKGAIMVQYDDGTLVGVQLGRRYGNAAGLVIPHEIVSPCAVGDVLKTGDPIAYNQGFFEPDFFNPKEIVWKSSQSVKTVLLESADTLEDSCAISERLSGRLNTKISKCRTIVVNFDQQIHKLVKVGDQVEFDSPLCLIEEPTSGGAYLLDDKTVDTLRSLTAQTPQAKIRGVVERVEIFYHGDKEDMSATLLEMSNASDRLLAQRQRSQGKKAFTGSVNENFRIDNDPLTLDTAAIRVYITTDVAAGVGDKGVFGNQLKTVFGRVFKDGIKTETGETVDAIFGAKSVDDRIVLSPYIIGTTTTLLEVIAKRAIAAYEG